VEPLGSQVAVDVHETPVAVVAHDPGLDVGVVVGEVVTEDPVLGLRQVIGVLCGRDRRSQQRERQRREHGDDGARERRAWGGEHRRSFSEMDRTSPLRASWHIEMTMYRWSERSVDDQSAASTTRR
jgi:hypothetical protein